MPRIGLGPAHCHRNITDGRWMCVWMIKDYHDNTNKQIRNIVNRKEAFVLFAIMNSGTN